ncbi:MAG: hypothetical protein WCK35_19395 [Chloroflexota bacterium]
MPSILFVCTGNYCRSPLAVAFFNKHLEKSLDKNNWQVDSAGTWTRRGSPAPPFCIELARQVGVNLSKHRAQLITFVPIEKYDLVIVMEKSHKEALLSEFPAIEERVFLLSSLAGLSPYDIRDPIQKDTLTAQEIIRDLRECIGLAFETIHQRAYALAK